MKKYSWMVILLMVIALSITTYAIAQSDSCTQSFYLQVKERNQALIGFSVDVNGMHYHTDENGVIWIQNDCATKYHIMMNEPDYEKIDTLWVYQKIDTVELQVKTKAITLDDVEISGHRLPISTNNNIKMLHADQIRQYQGKTLAEMLSQFTGVTSIQTGNNVAKPVIHGMHGNRLLILNNGVRQEGQQWGYEHAPEIDPYIFDQIAVVKGAEAVRYGADAVGGVILLNPSKILLNNGLYGNVRTALQQNGMGGSLAAQLNAGVKAIPGLGWSVQGSMKRLGNGKSATYYLNNTGMKDYNYSAMLNYVKHHFEAAIYYSATHADLGILSAAHIGSLSDLNRIIEAGRPFEKDSFSYAIRAPYQNVQHQLLKVNIHNHINDYWHLNIQYAYQKNQRKEFDNRRAGRTEIPALNIQIQTHTLDAYVDHIHATSNYKFGVNASRQDNASDPLTMTIPLIPDFIKQGAGLYVIAKKQINQHHIEAGARADYQHLNALGYDRQGRLFGGKYNFWNYALQVGWQYNPSALLQLKSNISTAYRPPNVNELYSTGLHHGAAQMEYGDSTLKSEQSVKWMNSFAYQSDKLPISMNVEMYYHYFQNYIYLSPKGTYYATLRGAYPEMQYKQARAHFYGIDADVTYEINSKFQYAVKGSLIFAKHLDSNTFLPMIPTHQLQQELSYNIPVLGAFQSLRPSITHQYVAGQYRYETGTDFSMPPAAYHLFGFNMQARTSIGNNPLFINLGIQNLTNNQYKNYLNRYRYFAHDLGINAYININYHF